jgi:LPS export ABC transporter permease LptF/LPS export ABC transporter permease LptG
MLRITDRYILREIIPPFFLALLVFTFLLMIPPIMTVAEELITKGVDGLTIVKIMATLLPQGLGITIPMALLLGVLIGFGRLSSDRETVALQACGVSVFRMLTPLLLLATLAAMATAYVLVVALPDANQAFREITYRTVASRAEGEVKPRVFYEDFPNVMLYAREVSNTGAGWTEVFLADTRKSDEPNVYVAERGQVILDREQRRLDIVLYNGTGHRVESNAPEMYEVQHFDELIISLDPESVFPRTGPQRGYPELTISELDAEAVRLRETGSSPHRPIMEIHRKFSIPVACFVFALIGLGLGVTSRKDGRLASFALGIAVIFAYYVIMYTAESLAKGALVSPHLAMWLPNIVMGLLGMALLIWRSNSVERRLSFPFVPHRPALVSHVSDDLSNRPTGVSIPNIGWLRLNILDWYLARLYGAVAALAFLGLLGIFYISTFIDLSDELFKGQTTGWVLLEYFWYATPQFIYWVLPISILIATLVALGLLTKSSELTVMKACGISLYRTAVPLLLFGLLWSGLLFALSESILGPANRRAEALNHMIRSGSPQTIDVFNRKWIVAGNGSIYHYLHFEPGRDEINNLSIYEFKERPWGLSRRTFVRHAAFTDVWQARDTWERNFAPRGAPSLPYYTEAVRAMPLLEPPEYFATDRPDAELMSYTELKSYIEVLKGSGFDVIQLVVSLHRKASFPFVALVLTLIAIPFAVTTGSRGALYGVGVGISIACGYWVILSVFGAIGSAGLLSPSLAAWAPNIIFTASASYLLFTVQT